MSIGYRIEKRDKYEIKKLIDNLESDYNSYGFNEFSSIRDRFLRHATEFLEKIVSIESFDEEYKKRSRELLEIKKDLTKRGNNIKKSQKQEKLEKTDSFIELYNLRNKGKHKNEMQWGESSINTKLDNDLLQDDFKEFADAVMTIKEQAKVQYRIRTKLEIEERRKEKEEREKRLKEEEESERRLKEEEERKESLSTELIPVQNKSIFEIWIEKLINTVKSFKLPFFGKKKDDNSIIDVEYREVENSTGEEKTGRIFVSRVDVNMLEDKEKANNGKYSSGERDR